MLFDSEKYEELFTIKYEDSLEEKIESIKNNDISFIRVKTWKPGKQLESEIYPVWNTKRKSTRVKKKTSRVAQKNLNDKNAKKHITRLINQNFTEEDIILTVTYKGKPPDWIQARKDIQNYIRRLKDYRRKHGLPELKYVYVIEYVEDGNEKKRVHFHLVINSMDRDIAERLWGKGYANSRRLQPDEFGFEGLARYITKDPKGTKRWSASRNLKIPVPSVADHKLTKRKAEKIAKNQNVAKEIFEKIYPGYIFNDINVKFSEFASGAYIYVRMRKNDNFVKKREKWK